LSAFTWPPEGARGVEDRTDAAELVAAAVLVPLYRGADAEAHVVLTRRRADLRRHAGEISFPGGREDPGDRDLTDTALREAEEEIGLAREHVRLLGALSPTLTRATGYVIHPFLGMIPAGLTWTPSDEEVAAILELPLEALRSGRTRSRIERRGIVFETDTFVVGEHMIWGATARIIEKLLERIDEDDSLEDLRAGSAAAHRPVG
jgi:8-oxo-dGTP pyrophosphatase MutT (NUDIX family)